MNDKPRFYVHGVSAEAWARRYGITVFSHPCMCGRLCTISLPFAQGVLRGLQAPPCACGNERTPYGLVRDPKYGDLLSGVEP